MPHTGLIPSGLSKIERAMMRAKLHVHGANKRLSTGEIADGFAAYYDALLTAMLRYTLSPKLSGQLHSLEDFDTSNDAELFSLLNQSGVFRSGISQSDFEFLHDVTYSAMDGRDESAHVVKFKQIIDVILTDLGVLPILDDELPIVEHQLD